MKTLFITLLAIVFFNNTQLFGQESQDEVTLTVLGEASTIEESKLVALRSAIEQAFGTFVSSNTQILNDELVKDEIVSLSSGNIKSFDVLSQLQLPNGNYLSTIKAVVSISKLQSYSSSKGVKIEFAGGLFAANIKISELAKQNEEKAVQNTVDQIKKISKSMFDFQLANGTPKKNDHTNKYEVKLNITVKANDNYLIIQQLLYNLLEGVNMSESELEFFRNSNIQYFPVTALIPEKQTNRKGKKISTNAIIKHYNLRSERSKHLIHTMVSFYIPISVFNASIDNGIENKSIKNILKDMANSGYDYKGNYLFDLKYKSNFYYYLNKCIVSMPHKSYYGVNEDVILTSDYFLNNISKIPHELKGFPVYLPADLNDENRWVIQTLNRVGYEQRFSSQTSYLQLNLLPNNNDVHYNYNIIDRRTLEEIQKITGYTIEPVK